MKDRATRIVIRIDGLGRRLWRRVPRSVTEAAPVWAARRVVLTWLRGAPPAPLGRAVRSVAEVDEVLALLERAGATSDDELRRGFAAFHMPPDAIQLPSDPFSEGYRRAVMRTYEQLHGGPHQAANEVAGIDAEVGAVRPFPYLTGSTKTAGDHLVAIGNLLRVADLAPGSRVLELGAGWGNLTIALAQLGHRVTAVEISPHFSELIGRRAQQVGVEVELHTGDFGDIAHLGKRFDAVIFFESFHHCSDHQRLLSSLDHVISEGGKVIFAGEPITSRFPVPWGLRLDGESLWAIRRNGWLELGFRTSYFHEVLVRHGWRARAISCPGEEGAAIYVARRSSQERAHLGARTREGASRPG